MEVAALRTEMKMSNEGLREEIKLRLEASDRHTEQLIRALSDKLEFTIEIRERLASIEPACLVAVAQLTESA